ncbi:rSAM/selenodomain-associated transferase 2 [Winogradskyella epiphytica]|uniref:RSAM/selenodomain-associated transferase 2 n=1 Tax=Winogradskyella epiphytica TaxID=262005 RepID=A0A2V4WZI1_9FLAO|nr:TIGR04283 family arsenosugar biosynthesis glycosyltransferase [Winogradskyella epiphytica]PYE82828.1 rSAM/selenodomain-associated transferase 2 [Winogradskyella epiphytica]GGW53936.1 glycosyl hydrolase [Winogradskyella epiphytica]
MTHQISIIIPVLNEVEIIGNLLSYLSNNSTATHISEIIVVDGGSTDGTLDLVRSFSKIDHTEKTNSIANSKLKHQPNIILIDSLKGRAKQMNLGAKNAQGNILYFLHADSFPPKDFDQFIINEVQKGNKAGCFRMQFDSNHWWLRLASWLTQFSWRACRGGDQSQFITKELFDDIGGYDENYIIYEDNILINELYARQEFKVINKKLKNSARLYRTHGVWNLQYHFWTIYVKKWLGASAEDLLAYYNKHIH